MIVQRREIWWADLDLPRGSEPGYGRPVLIIQADAFNRSRIQTVLGLAVTSNLRLLRAPGNVLLPKNESGLAKDSVANVSQLVTLDRDFLTELRGRIPPATMARVDAGLRLVLDL